MVEPISKRELQELYVVGIRRNLVSVVSSIYVGELEDMREQQPNATQSGRGRGNLPEGLLYYLFSTATVSSVIKRIQRTFKSEIQGGASFHDLALAHCLLFVLRSSQNQNRDRNSNLASSSMALGRVIQPLRELQFAALNAFQERLPSLVPIAELKRACSAELERLTASTELAMNVNRRSSNLKNLDLSPNRLLAAYAILHRAGLDQRPFEEFFDAS